MRLLASTTAGERSLANRRCCAPVPAPAVAKWRIRLGSNMKTWFLCIAVLSAMFGSVSGAGAKPLVPASDDQVLVRLGPKVLPKAAQATPQQAVAQAQTLLEQARRDADPRPAGLALGLLAPWSNDAQAPADVVVMRATLQQHLHRFDQALTALQSLVERDRVQPQAWLTLATLHRLQGRYAQSDQACQALLSIGQKLHGQACLAENISLRGDVERARAMFEALLAKTTQAPTRAWLHASLAELHARTGQPALAEAAWRAALGAAPDGYASLGLADVLIAQGRLPQALQVLRDQPASDAVLLRRHQAGDVQAGAELRQRQAGADVQAAAAAGHARELSLYALHVQGDAAAAVALARINLRTQREPIDLLLLGQAARRAGDRTALDESLRLAQEIGMHDERLQALR